VSKLLCELFPEHVRLISVPGLRNRMFEVDGIHKVSFFVCREFRTLGGRPRDGCSAIARRKPRTYFWYRADPQYQRLLSYHVLPPVGNSVRVCKQIQEKHPWLATGKELNNLGEFYRAVTDIAQREASPVPVRARG